MRVYDVVLVLKTNLTDAKRSKFLETVKSWVKNATVTRDEAWGQKVLSYPIKHEYAGYFHFLSLNMEAIPTDFEKRLLASEDVLRHLVIRQK